MSTAAQPFCRQVCTIPAWSRRYGTAASRWKCPANELDRISGLADGHVAKIVSPQPIGIMSLGAILQTLGLVLVIIEDPMARDKTLARRPPFQAGNRRVGNKRRAASRRRSKARIPSKIASPTPRRIEPVPQCDLRVVQSGSKGARWGGARPCARVRLNGGIDVLPPARPREGRRLSLQPAT
jgi:hypothetical protein